MISSKNNHTSTMVRKQIYLTNTEVKEMTKLASVAEISVSEYIRRVIDNHISQLKSK